MEGGGEWEGKMPGRSRQGTSERLGNGEMGEKTSCSCFVSPYGVLSFKPLLWVGLVLSIPGTPIDSTSRG